MNAGRTGIVARRASATQAAEPRVSVHIERVTIHGPAFDPAQRQQFEVAFQSELARLVALPGIDRWGVAQSSPALSASTVTAPAHAPVQLAREVAHSVFASLSGGSAGSLPRHGRRP